MLLKFVLRISDIIFGYQVSKQLEIQREYTKLSEVELNNLQLKKLEKIIKHAISTVPAYKNIDINKADSIKSQINTFPVLNKIELQGKENYFLSKKFSLDKLIKLESSGSSGIKTTVYLTKKEHSILRAILIVWWEWTGYFVGKPILQTGITPNRGIQKWIKDKITNTVYCNAFSLDDKQSSKYLKKMKKYKNPHLGGFASSLFVLAEYAEKNNLEIKFDAAISWGDKMFDHYKDKIEKVFKTKVFENYGCNEGLMIGQKVDLDFFYLYTPNVYLEILDDNNNEVDDGEVGRVIVTKLDGWAMPLIRYDTGDLAVKLPRDEYPISRKYNFPLLKKVIGRNTDVIRTPEGKNLIVHTFTGIFEFYEQIKQFRVIQTNINEITIEYIPSVNFDVSILEHIEKDFKIKTKSIIGIKWISVNQIPSTKSGKPQLIKNYLIENSLSESR
jgi:phenylacetate-CoA ligase